MADWVLTIPAKTEWSDYEKELAAVADGQVVLNYRVPFKPKVEVEDRCFCVWRGRVRGWIEIVGVAYFPQGFRCQTTGVQWPPGYYIQRSGPFHAVDGPEMKGFRGIRRFHGEA